MGDILLSPTPEKSLRETYGIPKAMGGNKVQDLILFSSSSDEELEISRKRRDRTPMITHDDHLHIKKIHESSHSYCSKSTVDPLELKRARCRGQFWESYAKQLLLIWHENQMTRVQQNCDYDEAGIDCQTSEKRLNDMAMQMCELGESLNRLKMHGEAGEQRIQCLEEELKRTERVKNSYKKEIKALKSLLEDNAKHAVTRPHSDAAAMQAKLSSMRVYIESLKSKVDKMKIEKNVLQGEHQELKDRCCRREEALQRAQKRCRDLEKQIKNPNLLQGTLYQVNICDSSKMGSHNCGNAVSPHEEEAEQEEQASSSSVPIDSSPLSIPLSQNTGGSKEYIDASTWMDEDDTLGTTQDDQGNDPVASAVQEEHEKGQEQQPEPCAAMIHSTKYDTLFGGMDISDAEIVVLKADETLEKCISSIKLLLKKLHTSEESVHQLQSLCATHYDQIYSYKNSCSHLQAKKVHLETYIARLEQSSAEYQEQMEHVLANQRHAAAQESHHLHQELQLMSEEQARLLVKLQAAENDLAKARALCRQLSSSCQVPQQPDICETIHGTSLSPDNDDVEAPISSAIYPAIQKLDPPGTNVVQRLQTIAQGLKSISSSGTVDHTHSI